MVTPGELRTGTQVLCSFFHIIFANPSLRLFVAAKCKSASSVFIYLLCSCAEDCEKEKNESC